VEVGRGPTAPSDRVFAAYDRSARTGLDYAVNRSYDPQQGRFTQVDPQELAATNRTDPQSLNMYTFARNDPVNLTDPAGLQYGCVGGTVYIGGSQTIFNCVTFAPETYVITGEFIPETVPEPGFDLPYNWFVPVATGYGETRQSERASENTKSKQTRTYNPKDPCLGGTSPNIPSPPVVSGGPERVDIQANIQEAESGWKGLIWFGRQVHNKGPWDYKQVNRVASGVPSPYEDFGNFNYGATGATLRIDDPILLRFAGLASIIAESSRFKENGVPWGKAPYGDFLKDQEMIMAGIQYAKCSERSH
jgi:RHS repeat-associated protein